MKSRGPVEGAGEVEERWRSTDWEGKEHIYTAQTETDGPERNSNVKMTSIRRNKEPVKSKNK